MALATYSDLQTSIASWLARPGDTNITAVATDLIALFEARFQRNLRVRQMESRATTTISAQNTSLPSGWLGMRSLKYTDSGGTDRQLMPMAPQLVAQTYLTTMTGPPKVYWIVGSEFLVAPTPDASYTAQMDYYSFSALSVSNTTNWLLTSHPDIYLFGSLTMAEAFIMDDQRVGMWKQMLEQAMQELHAADKRDRWSGGPLMARTDTGNP